MFNLLVGLAAAGLLAQESDQPVDAQTEAETIAASEAGAETIEAETATAEIDTRPITERGEELRYWGRFRGWEIGEMSGRLSTRQTSSNILGLRRGSSTRVTLTVETGAYEDNPLSIVCEAGETLWGLEWVDFDKDELVYSCTFTQNDEVLDTRFEMALENTFLGRGDRAGEYRSGDTVLRFSSGEMSSMSIAMRMVEGYTIYQDERDVGALDYGMTSISVYVPQEPGELRDHVLIVSALLATYADPS